jgi:hypothetical protein
MSSITAAPKNGLRRPAAQGPELDQHGRRDADAGRDERHADEYRGRAALAQGEGQGEPAEEGQDDAHRADHGGAPTDLAHLGQPCLEADPEKQEDHSELGEDLEHLSRLHEPERRRPDHDAGQDLADEPRLMQALEELVAELRGEEHDEKGDEMVGHATAAASGTWSDTIRVYPESVPCPSTAHGVVHREIGARPDVHERGGTEAMGEAIYGSVDVTGWLICGVDDRDESRDLCVCATHLALRLGLATDDRHVTQVSPAFPYGEARDHRAPAPSRA